MERHKDDPFVLLGINTDQSKDDYHKKAKEYGVNWRSSWQGSTSGPIPRQWRVSGYPTKYVLDGEGRIRHTMNVGGPRLDKVIAELLEEQRGKEEAEGAE